MDYWNIRSNLSIEARHTLWEKVAILLAVYWPKNAVDESRKINHSSYFPIDPNILQFSHSVYTFSFHFLLGLLGN